ncbi:MAG: DUF3300 domain-containing protein [Desulfobacteraceae bacterium]|nr:DUF3300 domain-containing protein [Desulfobacteraceae bacterium]
MTRIISVARVVRAMVFFFLFATVMAPWCHAETPEKKTFKPEELEQIVAPIALYPDSLLAQILMASTYPLEVVQAERWQKKNKDLKGDALAKELEKQSWDASVKSLVSFPEVLTMMSEKLDWTQKLGDAFLAQQKEVMDSVQTLRKKAEAEGNLKSTKEQKVATQEEKIVIVPADPQVVYVPVYNPTVVYGVWPYPAYPPYYYYPPAYVYPPGGVFISFTMGVMIGSAWSHYGGGGCNWNGGNVYVNHHTTNINVDRGAHVSPRGGGNRETWQHNPEHRQGVPYRDQTTGQKYNRASTNDAVGSRENFRGRSEAGQRDIDRGGAGPSGSRPGGAGVGTLETGSRDRGDALSGMDRGGSTTRDYSSRGSTSRESMSSSGRGSFSGGGSRSFGGGGRGGGRR